MELLKTWLEHYRYIILLSALILELIALPIPGEILMSYCGFLVFQGKLGWWQSIVTASTGAILGITLSYWLGFYLGIPFFKKYGNYIHMGPDKLSKISKWFEKYGVRLLSIAYFIPGIRHITGYFSGITKISYRKFAAFAYIGAVIWTGTFISLGKVLGPKWEEFHDSIKKYLGIASIVIAAILILIFLYRTYRVQITNLVVKTVDNTTKKYASLGKAKFLITSVLITFFTLFGFVISLIQDLFANEFTQFDDITAFLVKVTFTEKSAPSMHFFGLLATYKIFIPLILFTLIWIIYKGRNKRLEIYFYALSIVGAEILDESLRSFFHRLGPIIGSIDTFPSEQSLVSLVVYGSTTFFLIRHAKNRLANTIVNLLSITILVLIGLSRIFFEVQYPSDVVAGYVFGGAWLSFNILLLEIYRIQASNISDT